MKSHEENKRAISEWLEGRKKRRIERERQEKAQQIAEQLRAAFPGSTVAAVIIIDPDATTCQCMRRHGRHVCHCD